MMCLDFEINIYVNMFTCLEVMAFSAYTPHLTAIIEKYFYRVVQVT